MRSINKVVLIGNLTRDPELRQTTSGQSVATFGLATNREWMTKDGARHTSTEFHELVAWARLAEICEQYLKKGKLIYVEGYLKTRSWDTPEGIKKFKTEIIVQDMIILEKRPKDSDALSEPHEETFEETTMEESPEAAKDTAPKEEKSAPAGAPSIDEDLGL